MKILLHRLRHILSLTFLIFVMVLTENSIPHVSAQSGICQADFQSVAIPLTELGNAEYIRMDGQATGFSGGLYPNGLNTRPPAHERTGQIAAAAIQPLDTSGNSDPDRGKIVMISIGMSNTNYEFETFIQAAHADDSTNPHLVLVNGALPGQTSDRWTDPAAPAWLALEETLANYQVSAAQVQVAWIKLTRTGSGDFPEKAELIQSDLEQIVHNLYSAYPNVKIVYFSSRIYSYTYFIGLSPEPNAYEGGFAVKWLLEKQINGDPALNNDPARGDVTAPFLAWGPYLWANGEMARLDGLQWLPEDLTNDCTHPSASGRIKVANLLLDFLQTDSTSRSWFLRDLPENEKLFLPLIRTATVTPQKQTPVIIASPTVEIAAVLTPTLTLELPPTDTAGGLFQNIWAAITGWFRRFFGRR